MVVNARVADLVRENRADEITEAIADGDFFQMQTFTQALIDLVLAGRVEREIAANAASNKHDFLVALERAVKQRAVRAANAQDASKDSRPVPIRPEHGRPAAPVSAPSVRPEPAEQAAAPGLRIAPPGA